MNRSAKSIVGKTIIGAITRPVGGGRESVVMLQFSDGSCFEFVSPRARGRLNRMAGDALARGRDVDRNTRAQLSFFPQDGVAGQSVAPTAAAA